MANIIDHTAFTTGEFAIQTNNLAIDLASQLDLKCGEVESDILTKLLGDVLYLDFSLNKSLAKYAFLINGYKINGVYSSYDFYGTPNVFYGFIDMLKFFTYYFYIKDQKTFNSIVGEVSPNQENSSFEYPTRKVMKAWNKGLVEYKRAVNFIQWSNANVPNTYMNFIFEPLRKINSFGL